jgi:Acyl-CoA reductase (LuxC)
VSIATEPHRTETDSGTSVPLVPAIIRGKIVEDNLVTFTGRGDALTFVTPDPHRYVNEFALSSPTMLRDLYALSFDEILDYLDELGQRLNINDNEHMQWARELTYATSPATKPLIDNDFRGVARFFNRDRVRHVADKQIGLDYLNGWVDSTLPDGTVASVRAFGARALHIIPGNGGGSAANAIVKNAFTRSDCIIKTPSNNPFSAVAIARTMCEMAPDHPITKHVTVAYWRGGDEELERRLYQPHNIDKILAWGGFASVKHVTRYIQPGLELISLDPKFSASVIGEEALSADEKLREAALRLAVDTGAGNQQFCSSARVAYVVTGDRADAVERVNRLGEYVYEELMALPTAMSTKSKQYDAELRSNVESARLQDDFYYVVGGEDDEGCVIVSQLPDPVDFSALLNDRTVNLVPVETIDEAVSHFDSYTQTVGVYPENVKEQLLDVAPFYGVQRFVSLGYSSLHTGATPHDGIEVERRMCKWIVNQSSQPIPLSYAASRNGVAPDDQVGVTPSTLEALRQK